MSTKTHYLQKELYEKIKKDPAVFEFLQEGSLDGLWYWDLENPENEWMSSRFWTTLGYDPSEKKHRPSEWQDLIHPEDLKLALDNFNKHCADPNHPYDQVVRYRHKDGSTVWIRCRGNVIRDENGKPIRMLGAHTNLTPLKKAEESLRTSERELKRTLDATTDGIWSWNFKTGQLFFSPRYYTMLGYAPGEFPAGYDAWVDLIHPDDREKALAVARNYLKTKPEIYENEFRLKTKSGEYRWIRTRAKVVERDENGNAVNMIGNHDDITDRKIAEEALLHNQKMLTRTERIAHIGSWEWEIANDTVMWSEELYRIFQLDPNEKAPNWAEQPKLYVPEDFDKLRKAVEKAVADGTPYALEIRALRKDGEIRNCLAHGYPEKNSVGQVVRFFGSLHDITERKQTEVLIRTQRDLSIKLSLVNKLDEGLEFCVDTALLVSGMDCGGIYLLDKISGRLDLVFQKGLSKQFERSAFHFEPDSANTKLVLRGKPIYTQHQRLGVPIDGVKIGERLKAIAVVPIIHQNQVIGSLNVASHTIDEVPVFSRDALETIASQIGSAIINLETEEALRKSEERFRELAELLPETIFEIDLNGTLTFVNRGAFGQFGYTIQDFEKGLNAFEMVSVADRQRALENVEKVLKGETVGLSEYQLQRKDGTTFPGILNSEPIFRDGKPVGLRGLIIDITDRKHAEEQLVSVAREWHTTFDALSDAIWLLDNDFKIIRCNKATERILHKPMRDIVGKFCWQIVHGTKDVLPECPILRMKKSLKRESLPLQIGDRGFDIIVEPLLNENRQIEGAVHILRDVTEQKQAQEALQKNEQFLERVFEAIRDGISVLDTDLNVIRTNRRMEEMYLHNMPLTGKKCFEAYQERRSPCPWCPTLKTIETGEKHSEIVPYPSGDAPKGWIELSAFPLKNEENLIEGVIEYVKDISEHKRAEMALKESEERFKTLVEQSPLGVSLIEKDGRYVYVNPRFVNMFGYSTEDIPTGPEWFTKAFPDINERRKAIQIWIEDQKEASVGQARPRVFKVTCKDGSKKRIHFRPVTLETRDQFVLYEDITERANLEFQLQQAQKMESVGRLAGGVAHDFNNMLSVILGQTELLLMDMKPGDPHHTALEEIQKAAKRSADLTRQLLAFARRQTIAPKVLDLNETIEGMLKMLRRLIGEDIDLVWKPDAGLWPVNMDPAQIDQILANLCVNARDAISDVGNVIIETENVVLDEDYCAIHEGCLPGEYVLLAVSDDGCGMDGATQSQIFEPFFTTKEVGEGTGLGLATVYGIVKQNDGFINLYSEVGKGTTFRIYIPRHEGMVIRKTAQDLKALPRGQGETVLLVEDDRSILDMGKAMLERLGYQVLPANGPMQALELCKTHPGKIDLLMTDVVMPQMSGKALAGQIKAIKPGISILYMSGYTADAIAHRGVLDDEVYFIQKPFSLKDLAAKVKDTLDGI